MFPQVLFMVVKSVHVPTANDGKGERLAAAAVAVLPSVHVTRDAANIRPVRGAAVPLFPGTPMDGQRG